MNIQYEKEIIEMSDEFSFNKGNPLEIPDGVNVYASSFYTETPDSEVFRKDMKGVTFYNCNLDNCVIPEGNTVIGGSCKRFKVQNDGNDWIIDENDQPIKPVNYKIFNKLGLEIPKPEDIPEEKGDKVIDLLELAKQ